MSCFLLILTLRCPAFCGVWLSSVEFVWVLWTAVCGHSCCIVLTTVEFVSALSCLLVKFDFAYCGVDSAVSCMTTVELVSCLLWSLWSFTLLCPDIYGVYSAVSTVKFDSAVSCPPRRKLVSSFNFLALSCKRKRCLQQGIIKISHISSFSKIFLRLMGLFSHCPPHVPVCCKYKKSTVESITIQQVLIWWPCLVIAAWA